MSNFTIEITAPSIVAVLEKLISVINPKTFTPILAQSPQTPAEQAVRQQVIPARQPTPTYTPPTAPGNQPPMYAVPPQPYQSAAPVNPTPGASMPTSPMTGAGNTASGASPAPTSAAPTTYPSNPAPTTTPTYSADDLARAASQLMDAGRQQDVLGLLARFNVQALTQLPPAQYGAFATELRQMGAKV